jgi:xylan 1,4-beta-xylosidase
MGRPGVFSFAVCTQLWSRCKAGIELKACVLPLCAAAWLASLATPAAEFPVTVKVDVAQGIGALPPVWRFFGADEPNYATSAQGERLLMELGSLRPGQVYFRAHNLLTTGPGTADFKWGSTNIYTENAGAPIYDYTLVDRIIDSYLARGIHPYLELGFMPEAMSAAPGDVPYRRAWEPGVDYRGKLAGWSFPPRDFAKWAALIYQWTRHNVERYGRAEVERWYFEVWNEANLEFYWSDSAENFYRLHDYAIEAVRRALPAARVGGPDSAGSGGAFMDGFLDHVTTGTNYATGKIGTPTDFLSFHAKGQPTVVNGHVRMGISNQLRTVDEAFAKIASRPQLAGKPIIIGENDPDGCAACPAPQNAYRNGPLYSSYTAASYARLWELARRHQVALEGAVTWAFTFVGQPWFAGYRQLATNGVDLPVLNVFRLFSRLGTEQIAATSSAELPLEQIVSEGVAGSPDVGVLATRSDSGRVDILLWHYRDDDVAGPSAHVHLVLTGFSHRIGPHARVWRIDAQNGNPYKSWQAMGSPGSPTKQQIEQLIHAARLSSQSATIEQGRDGAFSMDRRLPLQSVELIELRALNP